MLIFGHVGITSAAAKLIDTAFPPEYPSGIPGGIRPKISSVINRFRDKAGNIDYRMVIIGSMLPDIIDKPLFLLSNNSEYFSGRGITHSLVLNLLLLTGGFVFKKSWLLLLWFGSLMHLVLDQMWGMPVNLFWPFMGWFPVYDREGWFDNILEGLLNNPDVFIPEIIGFFVVLYLGFRVLKNKGIIDFIRKGIIG